VLTALVGKASHPGAQKALLRQPKRE